MDMGVQKGDWGLGDKDYVQILQDWVAGNTERVYQCRRGPRPSAALIVTETKQMVYGAVVPPKGSSNCHDAGCEIENDHCVRCIHAEVQAILKCAEHGVYTKGATIYSINKPCYQCSKAIINAGITRIVYIHTVYDEARTSEILHNAGMVVDEWSGG